MAKIEIKIDSFYSGEKGNGDVLFPLDKWILFQKHLSTAEIIMKMISSKYNFRFLKEIKSYWPARRLQKRKLITVYEIQISLNPNYMQDEDLYYVLFEHIYVDYFGWYQKTLKFQQHRRYSIVEIENKDQLIDDLKEIFSKW